jgi:hypothetical protein
MRSQLTAATIGLPLCLGAAAAGAQAGGVSSSPGPFAGCYVLRVSNWTLPSYAFATDSVLPRLIRLDTVAVAHGGWLLTPDVSATGDSAVIAPHWLIKGDTVDLFWPSGPRPTRVKFWRFRNGKMAGGAYDERARTPRWRRSAGAEAWRVACETDSPARYATEDSARLVGDRLVIEPFGASFRIPPLWLGVPDSTPAEGPSCGNRPDGSLEERFHLNRRLLPAVTHAEGEWRREFSAVVDSVLPLDALVAQVGGGRWSIDGHCALHVQLRVYVGDFTGRWVLRRATTVGAQTAAGFFSPVRSTASDSAEWHGTRLRWQAWYYDYGGTAHVEFRVLQLRRRTIALVFMYVGGTRRQLAERGLVMETFRYQP